MLNGEDFTAKSEVILDGKSLMIGPGKFMKPTKPATQKEIELIKIYGSTFSIWAGDESVFTGTTPNDAPYALVFEEWRTDGEWTRSDEWFTSAESKSEKAPEWKFGDSYIKTTYS